jgi:hypothetical protein
MNITTMADCVKSSDDITSPERTSVNLNAGNSVPKGSIVDVAAMVSPPCVSGHRRLRP